VTLAPEPVIHDYLLVLERAILDVRARIRYDDDISLDEVHDVLDAIHNIPAMLRRFGDWHVPENIDSALQTYDAKWVGVGSSRLRKSLGDHLKRAGDGEYDESG
jgi:hypothetical protein